MEMDNYMIIGQKFADTLYYLVKSFDEVMGKKFMDTNLGPFCPDILMLGNGLW